MSINQEILQRALQLSDMVSMRFFSVSFIVFLFSSPVCFGNEIIDLTCFKENSRFQINYRINNFTETVTFTGSYWIDSKKRFKSNYGLSIVEWKTDNNGQVREIWAIDNIKHPDYKKYYGNSLSTYYFNLNQLTYYSNRTYVDGKSEKFQGGFFTCYQD